jgi:hypothetical protein
MEAVQTYFYKNQYLRQCMEVVQRLVSSRILTDPKPWSRQSIGPAQKF